MADLDLSGVSIRVVCLSFERAKEWLLGQSRIVDVTPQVRFNEKLSVEELEDRLGEREKASPGPTWLRSEPLILGDKMAAGAADGGHWRACRKRLLEHDKAIAAGWKTEIQNQLVVVSVNCVYRLRA